MALERGDWIVVRIDEHRLHYKQIVVEGDNRVEQCYEHEDVDGNASSLQRAGEDEELAEETCERKFRIGLVKSVIVGHVNLACGVLNCLDHAEGCKV